MGTIEITVLVLDRLLFELFLFMDTLLNLIVGIALGAGTAWLVLRDESTQIKHLNNHAQQIRNHIKSLSCDNYWKQFDKTPEFVVMFLPGEVFFSAALQRDPKLIEYGIQRKIILATPTTLISLLKTVAYSWKQEKTTKNIQKIQKLGGDLHDRFATFTEHLIKVRKGLSNTLDAYDDLVGSYENRLLVTARKIQTLGSYDKEIEPLSVINQTPRLFKSEQ